MVVNKVQHEVVNNLKNNTIVNYDGELWEGGEGVDAEYLGIRPVFWINLEF